jgi:signal transduction histidine kinase
LTRRLPARAEDVENGAGMAGLPARVRTLYVSAWVFLAAVFAAVFVLSGAPPRLAARVALAIVLPWAAFGLLVVHGTRALPWPESRRAAFVSMQVLLATLYAAAGTSGWMLLARLDQLITTGDLNPRFDTRIVIWQTMMGGLLYFAVAGAAYAWRNDDRVREEAARAARADALRARAELQALRSQLNPHFVLNTLHTLIGLVRREPALAEDALERLGEILRYGLRVHREATDRVPFQEEWDFARSYLEIERLRLGDRLRLELHPEPGVMDCEVPPFTLQPLVENAIVHGIAVRAAGGLLQVTASAGAGRLKLEVRDDGPGLQMGSQTGTGLGLRLLRERLAALYGERASLRVETAASGGCLAVVELPLERPAAADVA